VLGKVSDQQSSLSGAVEEAGCAGRRVATAKKRKGRPTGARYDCRFCHQRVGRLNKLKEHWARVHFKESRCQRFLFRTGAYKCPVSDCDVTGIGGRKAFTAHIKGEHHHPKQLL